MGENSFEILQETSPTGDICHYNIKGLKEKDCKRFFSKFCRPPNIYLCVEQDCIELSDEEYTNLASMDFGPK